MAQYGGFGGFGGFGGVGGFGGAGGVGGTGLGDFLGAGAVGPYDPILTVGLQTTAEGIEHVTGDGPAPIPTQLPENSTANLARSADWVRGSLYLTDFIKDIGSTVVGEQVSLSFEGHNLVSVNRPSAGLMSEQAKFVRDYSDLRADRSAEITSQLGFPTEYFAMILALHPAQNRYTLELISMTQLMCAHTAMMAKYALAIRRPDQVDTRILPMIATPGHGSFPSAHATEAYGVATVMLGLMDAWQSFADNTDRRALVKQLANRISVNRTVAGVHYPMDSWAGASLGQTIGGAILGRCGATQSAKSITYTPQDTDFFGHEFEALIAGETVGTDYGIHVGATVQSSPSDLFQWLWHKALKEAHTGDGGAIA